MLWGIVELLSGRDAGAVWVLMQVIAVDGLAASKLGKGHFDKGETHKVELQIRSAMGVEQAIARIRTGDQLRAEGIHFASGISIFSADFFSSTYERRVKLKGADYK
jgi:hypothetical protein